MTRTERIEHHRQRIASLGLTGCDPFAGFRRCRKAIAGRPRAASAFKVLLARLDRLQWMLSNPGWSL